MKTEYILEIKVKNSPLLERKCNHCNCDRFYCSNKFRLNAQKKNIDVWLIYKCEVCDSTYNLTILSRTKPEHIKKDMLVKFLENDEDTAIEYAFSVETARKNCVKHEFRSVEYEVLHNNISINNIMNSGVEIVAFKIKTHFEFGLKMSSFIRYCLGISASLLDQMLHCEAIYTSENFSLRKHKVKNGDIVLLNIEKMQRVYKKNNIYI